MNSEGFKPLARQLSKNNQVIIYDQRGTGKSKLDIVDSQTITIAKMIDDIECIRNSENIKKWIVMGHSFGGMLASYYVSKFPETTYGLILSSSGGIDMSLFSSLNITQRLSENMRDSLQYWNQKISSGDTTHFAKLKRGTFLAPAYLHKKKYIPQVAERLTQGNR